MFKVGKIYRFLYYKENYLDIFWLILSEERKKYNILITCCRENNKIETKIDYCNKHNASFWFKNCEELV